MDIKEDDNYEDFEKCEEYIDVDADGLYSQDGFEDADGGDSVEKTLESNTSSSSLSPQLNSSQRNLALSVEPSVISASASLSLNDSNSKKRWHERHAL